MANLELTKLQLLTESQKLLASVTQQQWELYPGLQANFQALLDNALTEFGNQLEDIVPQLLEDNAQLQAQVSEQQRVVSEERQQLQQRSQGAKTYLKDTI